MTSRKQHALDAGYIAERMNPGHPGHKVVIYNATEQGLDDNGGRYAVVCDMHGSVCNETSLPRARSLMKSPRTFCEECTL